MKHPGIDRRDDIGSIRSASRSLLATAMLAIGFLAVATYAVGSQAAYGAHPPMELRAASTSSVSLSPWSLDPGLYAVTGASNTAVHAWGMRETSGAWGTGPVNYESGATTTHRAGASGTLSFDLSGTYCPGGQCSFGSGTGYKAFVQFWNDPEDYVAFGLIHDPGVSPDGTTIMVEGAAQGQPIGGYWPPGAVPGDFHQITVRWSSQGVLFEMDSSVTLGYYPITVTDPSVSFIAAGRTTGDIVDATFTDIAFDYTSPPVTDTGILPPENPPANIPPNPNYDNCSGTFCSSGPPCYSAQYPFSPEFSAGACVDAEVAAIDNARQDEGVAPLALPSDWTSLTPDEQVFVAIDLERVARGLTPFAGLNASLDQVAQQGADPPGEPAGYWGDPILPAGFSFGGSTELAWNCTASGGGYECPGAGNPGASIAAGGAIGALDADYGWMYDDGWGGSTADTYNVDCTSPAAAGCWGHRDNILGPYPTSSQFVSSSYGSGLSELAAPEPTTLVMGAGAYAPPGYGGTMDLTAIFVAVIGPPPPLVYTWDQAVAAGAGVS
jgi:hypothetical protein